jgi:RND family efflux transporter MFP subunit
MPYAPDVTPALPPPAIGLLFAMALLAPWAAPTLAAKGDAQATVTLAEVTREILLERVSLSATAEPRHQALLSPRVDGLVTRVLVDEGSRVAKDDPILELDARLAEIAVVAGEARVREAEARHRDAIRVRDELMRLEAGRHASATSIDSAVAQVEIAAAALARERAELERLRELRARHLLSAPFSGMIVARRAEVGQWVQQDDGVVELAAMDSVRVRAPLPQRYFPRVAMGAPVLVRFDALPGSPLEGRVLARVPRGNASTRSFPLLIDLPNPDQRLAPGMSARVEVELTDGKRQGLTVPRDALVLRADGSRRVWRVREAEGALKVEPVAVEVGDATGGRVELTGGALAAGDRVVLLGNESLSPGQTVVASGNAPEMAAD